MTKPIPEDATGAREKLMEALEDESQGKPSHPVLPLVGSENVPITPEEENSYVR